MSRPLLLLPVVLGLVACTRAPAEPPDPGPAFDAGASAIAPTLKATAATAPSASGGAPARYFPRPEQTILWNDPPDFVRGAPKSPARVAEYIVPRVGSDPEDGECVVMTFGPRQGGSVDENVKRWMDQFNPALPTPRRMTMDVNGMHVTFVEVSGTFAGNMMPNQTSFAMPKAKPGWRLIGAIADTPSGLWFFKMTGPDLTVRSGAREFEDMVRSARPK